MFAQSNANPSRRRFIRVSGGGVIAAALPVSGCSSFTDVPSEAIAPWQPKEAQEDIRRWVLSYAILAPNPHNRQPWLVDLSSADEIVLRIDTTRLLPHTDPFSRQILIGTGAMLSLLEVAAAKIGLTAKMTFFENQAFGAQIDSRPVARIRLVKAGDQTRLAELAALFAHIPNRRTVRVAYDVNRTPAPAMLAMLKRDSRPGDLTMSVALRSQAVAKSEAIATIAKQAFKIEMVTPRTMMESVHLFRIGSAEIAQHRDGISITEPLLVLLDKVGLFDRTSPPDPAGSIMKDLLADFDATVDSSPGFFSLVTQGNTRMDQLKSGLAYARAHLQATSFGMVMHPLSQALQEYPEMDESRRKIHQVLDAGDSKSGATVQMLCRLGYLPAGIELPGPSPRRGLSAHLKA